MDRRSFVPAAGVILSVACVRRAENVAYYHDLLYYKGLKTAEELLLPDDDAPYRLETVGFGVANWLLAEGDTTRAVEILEQIAVHPWWPGFGRIAAEAELTRLR